MAGSNSFPHINFSAPVQRKADLYGRDAEYEQIVQALTARDTSIIILGERLIGKTSLHNVVVNRLADDPRVVPLMLPSAQAIHSFEDYVREILQSLTKTLGKPLQSTGIVGKKGELHLDAFGQFEVVVARLLADEPSGHYILCLDEFDNIFHQLSAADSQKALGFTQYLIERPALPFTIFFTMTGVPDAIVHAYPSTLFSGTLTVRLSPLTDDSTLAMLTDYLPENVSLPADTRALFLRLAGGHPYFTKLLLKHIWYLKHPAGEEFTPLALEQRMRDAVDDAGVRRTLENIFTVHFNRVEKKLFLLLSELHAREYSPDLPVEDAPLPVIGIDKLHQLPSSFLTAAKTLYRRHYLARNTKNYVMNVLFWHYWLQDWEAYHEMLAESNVLALLQTVSADIEIDVEAHVVYLRGKPVRLTPQEYNLLLMLCRSSFLDRDAIADGLWGKDGAVTPEMIDSKIASLRRKLGDSAKKQKYIETVWGSGFRLKSAICLSPEARN